MSYYPAILMDQFSRHQNWFDRTIRDKPYQPSSPAGASPPSADVTSRSRDEDDVDVDNIHRDGPTQPDQRVPCKWGALSAAKTRDAAAAVLEDAVNRFTDLCRVSFSESDLQLSGPGGARIVWPVRDILRQKTSESLLDECITLSTRLYELIDDYNTFAEVIGTEQAMQAVCERVHEPDGLAPAVWALVNPESSIPEFRATLGRADKLAHNVIHSSPDKRAEWERAKGQLAGMEFDAIEEAIARLSGECKLSKAAVVMVALASTGRIWNTDPQTKSVLRAICPDGSELGEYYPLSITERTQLYVRMEVGDENRILLVDGVTWIVPAEARHTEQGMVTLYRKADSAPVRSIVLIWKRNPELDVLTEEMAQALQALSDVDKPWGRELYKGLRECMVRGVSPTGHEVAKVVAVARDAWKREYGITDPAVEGIMGAINVVYSFTIDPDDADRFCAVHCSRCFRLIGPHTTIDSIPLYKWDARQSNSSAKAQVGKRVAEMTTGVTRSVSRVAVLPHRMGYARVWRSCGEKARTGEGSSSYLQDLNELQFR